jgi:hypothetical protein
VEAKPHAWSRGTWRPWSIWLPGILALAWSALLIIPDGLAGVMGRWGNSDLPTLLRWQRAGVIGHSIIPAGLGWFLLTGRLGNG